MRSTDAGINSLSKKKKKIYSKRFQLKYLRKKGDRLAVGQVSKPFDDQLLRQHHEMQQFVSHRIEIKTMFFFLSCYVSKMFFFFFISTWMNISHDLICRESLVRHDGIYRIEKRLKI